MASAPTAQLSGTFTAILTSSKYHATRCQLIKQTWAAFVPPQHYLFYSDQADSTLPAIALQVAEYRGGTTKKSNPKRQQTRDLMALSLAQRKWIPAMVHAHGEATKLGTRWTLVVDDDTFVIPENVQRVLKDYDPAKEWLLGQMCSCPQCGFKIPEWKAARSAKTMCGGAGWAMTMPLHTRLLHKLAHCEARYSEHLYMVGSSLLAAGSSVSDYVIGGTGPPNKRRGGVKLPRPWPDLETQSDRILGRCFYEVLNVTITSRIEFCSQPPWFYEQREGRTDKPRGFGKPATFHYVSNEKLKPHEKDAATRLLNLPSKNGGDNEGAWMFLAKRLMPALSAVELRDGRLDAAHVALDERAAPRRQRIQSGRGRGVGAWFRRQRERAPLPQRTVDVGGRRLQEAASAMPSIAAASKELALAAAPHGVLLTTFTDAGGYLTALNWALFLRRDAGRTPCIGVDGPPPPTLAAQWKDADPLFYSLPGAANGARANGLERWTIRWVGLAALLRVDGIKQVVLSDTDVVWLRDPTPYFAALSRLHPHLDVAVGTDHATYAEAFRDDLPYSSTVMPTRRDLLGQWQRSKLSVKGVQRIDASAGVGLLPVLQFGSFLATKVVREASLYGARPFALHATHIVGQSVIFMRNNLRPMGPCTHPVWCLGAKLVTTGAIKALTMRQYRLWAVADAPSYYEGAFLTYTNRPARRFRRFSTHASGNAQWSEHLELLQEQLQDFQAAAAAALSLNRTLVLPRMLCTCVYGQWPFTDKGNLNCQPTHMQGLFPRVYECPPSYWLSMPEVLRSDVPLREPSFLEDGHHQAVKAITASTLTLHPCDAPKSGSNGGGKASNESTSSSSSSGGAAGESTSGQLCTVRGVPLVRARASYEEFSQALSPLRRARVLHLEAPRMGVGGFESANTAAAFARRVGDLLGAWCCAEGGSKKARLKSSSKKGRHRKGGFIDGDAVPAALEDLATDETTRAAIHGAGFQLRFRPKLGVMSDAKKAAKKARQWEVVPNVNNVFGRAELRRDTSCCKYVGQASTLDDCTSMAVAQQPGTTSATWHRSGVGGWKHSCYAIIDGTWQPVPVEKGQAEADSARLVGGRPLGPAPELAAAWITD